MSDAVYLDHHSATPVFTEVLDTYVRMAKDYWADMQSPHFMGQQPIYSMQKKIDSLFSCLGMHDSDLFFLSSGSRQNFDRVFMETYLEVSRNTGKTLFLTTQVEEESLYASCRQLESLGCMWKALCVNGQGQLTKGELEKAITSKTALVSISWANPLTGVIHPIQDLAQVCKEKNVFFHVDVSCVFGKNFFRFQDLDAHFVTLDGSVIGAMSGMGLIVSKKGFFSSYKHKIEPLAPLAAFSQAVLMMQEKFEVYCMETARLRDYLENGILEGGIGAQVLCKKVDRLTNCLVVAFPGIYSEALLYLLNMQGVYASRGGGKFQLLETILLSYGYSLELAQSAISFVLSWDTTQEQIDRVIEEVIEAVKKIKVCHVEDKGEIGG